MPKYKLTNNKIQCKGRTLWQIKALKDFGQIKANDLGGWIESEANLSQEGDCWVYGNAKVFGNAKVSEDATIALDAQVYGNAVVKGNSTIVSQCEVFDNAEVKGDSLIQHNAQVYGDAKILDDAVISGKSQVFGKAIVGGKAEIAGYANIFGDAILIGEETIAEHAEIKSIEDFWFFKIMGFNFTIFPKNSMQTGLLIGGRTTDLKFLEYGSQWDPSMTLLIEDLITKFEEKRNGNA